MDSPRSAEHTLNTLLAADVGALVELKRAEVAERFGHPRVSMAGLIANTWQYVESDFAEDLEYSHASGDDIRQPLDDCFNRLALASQSAVAKLSPVKQSTLKFEDEVLLGVKTLAKQLHSPETSDKDRARCMMTLAVAASFYKPDTSEQVTETKINDKATTAINQTRREYTEKQKALFRDPKYRDFNAGIRKTGRKAFLLAGKAFMTPEYKERLHRSVPLAQISENLLALLQGNPNLRTDFRDEVFLLDSTRETPSGVTEEPTETTPIRETRWTILPPEQLQTLGLADENTTGADLSSSEEPERQRFIDMDRMKWLGDIAALWGEDAYMAVANLDSTGRYDYRVAVLPQVLADGTKVEHAVVENPASNNATFVFRGERGLDEGKVWLTWQDVFQEHRRGATQLGARRIIHKLNHDDNVLEYLTRRQEALDKPGYQR